jgi:hypothetical protein
MMSLPIFHFDDPQLKRRTQISNLSSSDLLTSSWKAPPSRIALATRGLTAQHDWSRSQSIPLAIPIHVGSTAMRRDGIASARAIFERVRELAFVSRVGFIARFRPFNIFLGKLFRRSVIQIVPDEQPPRDWADACVRDPPLLVDLSTTADDCSRRDSAPFLGERLAAEI